jgi:hypothetical protein
MIKTNLQKEYESGLNWLQVYKETGVDPEKVKSMKRHVATLKRKMDKK